MVKRVFSEEQAKSVGEKIGIVWAGSAFDAEQFRMGMDVELEHGAVDSQTNVTSDDPVMTGEISLAHLLEFPDYYARLYKMEKEADAFWGKV